MYKYAYVNLPLKGLRDLQGKSTLTLLSKLLPISPQLANKLQNFAEKCNSQVFQSINCSEKPMSFSE